MPRITITTTSDLHRRLKIKAVENETTIRSLVTDAIENILEQTQPTGPS